MRNGEPEHSKGDNGKQLSPKIDYPPKYNNKTKTQKSSNKKSGKKPFSSVKNVSIPDDPDYNGTYDFNHISIDKINLSIIMELINNGNLKSSDIAAKLKIPLSTIQRRRTRIEKSIIKKTYQMDLSLLGYRSAYIFVDVLGGKARETAEELLRRFDKNIVSASTRINSYNNLCLEVVYSGSEELHHLLEEVKSLPVASNVDWSERVAIIGDNSAEIIKKTLSGRLEEIQAPKIPV